MPLVSKQSLWAGRIVSALTVAFLLVDGIMKVAKARVAVVGSIPLGYPENVVLGIGAVLLVCTLLYAIPRTSILGAILLTGYLGGAVATHVRASQHSSPMSCSRGVAGPSSPTIRLVVTLAVCVHRRCRSWPAKHNSCPVNGLLFSV